MGAITRHFRALILQTLMFAVFLLCAPSLANAQDIATGLIAHWKLDETSGTTATDSAGSNNGTMLNGLNATNDTIDGKINTALDFDGNDYVEIGPAVIGGLNEASVCTWFFYTGANPLTEREVLISKWQSGLHGWFLLLDDGSQTISFSANTLFGSSINSAAGLIQSRTWTHVCGTFKSGEFARIYVNGVQSAENTSVVVAPVLDQAGPTLRIASQRWGNQFNGRLDDVRLYNRALSAQDVEALATSFPGPLTCNAAYEAVMIYNHDESVMQYCNGTDWVDAGPRAGYSPNTVTFDGTNDWLCNLSDLTGNADGKLVSGSLWFRRNASGSGVPEEIYHDFSSNFRIVLDVSDRIRITAENAANTQILSFLGPVITDTNWHHVVFGIDMADQPNSRVYIDGVDATNFTVFTDDVIDFTGTAHCIGSVNPGNIYNGDLADLWIDIGTHIDLSLAANLENFIKNGRPVYLGANGEIPTATSPIVFLSGDTATWHTNKGTGGGFTETGALTDGTKIRPPGTCTNPGGIAGEVDYNFDDGTMQYCNGANWINMGPKILGAGGTGFTYTAPTTGLQGHWTLDETSGTSFADSSGNGYTGTASGGLDATNDSVAGQDGTAIEFDDDDDIDMGDIINLSGQQSHTFSIWVRFNVDPLLYSTNLINNGDINLWWNGANNFGIGDDVIFFDFDDGGTARGFANPTGGPHPWNPSINTWYMVTGVHDTIANETYLYIDGQLVGTRTGITQALSTSANTANIGASGTAGSAVQFDDGRIYDSALTAEEVYSLYRSSGGTNTGLTGHWTLDETSGTTASDSAGSNNGTMQNGLSGTDSTTGQLGTALNFDGTDDKINIPNIAALSSAPLTLSLWFNDSTSGANPEGLFQNRHSSSPWWNLEVRKQTNNIINIRMKNAASSDFIILSDSAISNGVFNHVAVTIDASHTARLYVNGALQTTTQNLSSLYPTTAQAEVGTINLAGYDYFDGIIDDIRAYDRALSAAEIADLYAQGGTAPSSAPTGCSTIGDLCSDGSIFAGDTNMYVTDINQSASIQWKTSRGIDDINPDSNTDGEANHANRAGLLTDFPAFELCENLTAHGQTDWYLPAQDETIVLYTNRVAIDANAAGAFGTGHFWTSTENANVNWGTCYQFDFGATCAANKDFSRPVRCIRRGNSGSLSGGTCSNPSGPAGEMIYNDANNIMQYCNGSEWVGIR